MSYDVLFSRAAHKDYSNLDAQTKRRIDEKLRQIADEPFSRSFSKQLVNQKGLRSARVGDWRILYLPDADLRLVNVDRIRRRRDVYANL